MLLRPKSFVCHCPLVTDVPAALPCPSLVEEPETTASSSTVCNQKVHESSISQGFTSALLFRSQTLEK